MDLIIITMPWKRHYVILIIKTLALTSVHYHYPDIHWKLIVTKLRFYYCTSCWITPQVDLLVHLFLRYTFLHLLTVFMRWFHSPLTLISILQFCIFLLSFFQSSLICVHHYCQMLYFDSICLTTNFVSHK